MRLNIQRQQAARFLTALTIIPLCIAAPAFAQQPQTTSVDAGPIWNQADANAKCPKVASNYGGKWNGQWWTKIPNKMSVCGVVFYARSVEAGPIWSQPDANKKCPAAVGRAGGVWDGQWWTTVPGKMSVCSGRFPTP